MNMPPLLTPPPPLKNKIPLPPCLLVLISCHLKQWNPKRLYKKNCLDPPTFLFKFDSIRSPAYPLAIFFYQIGLDPTPPPPPA